VTPRPSSMPPSSTIGVLSPGTRSRALTMRCARARLQRPRSCHGQTSPPQRRLRWPKPSSCTTVAIQGQSHPISACCCARRTGWTCWGHRRGPRVRLGTQRSAGMLRADCSPAYGAASLCPARGSRPRSAWPVRTPSCGCFRKRAADSCSAPAAPTTSPVHRGSQHEAISCAAPAQAGCERVLPGQRLPLGGCNKTDAIDFAAAWAIMRSFSLMNT